MTKKTRTIITDNLAGVVFTLGLIITMGSCSEIVDYTFVRMFMQAIMGLSLMIAAMNFKFRKSIYQTIKKLEGVK